MTQLAVESSPYTPKRPANTSHITSCKSLMRTQGTRKSVIAKQIATAEYSRFISVMLPHLPVGLSSSFVLGAASSCRCSSC